MGRFIDPAVRLHVPINMKSILLLILLASSSFADDPKPADVEQLKAQITALQAQLAMAQQNLEICGLPEVMRVRLAALDAIQKAKPPTPQPKPDVKAKP